MGHPPLLLALVFLCSTLGVLDAFLISTPQKSMKFSERPGSFSKPSINIHESVKHSRQALQMCPRMSAAQQNKDTNELKTSLLTLCEESKSGLVPFDSSTKEKFDSLVSTRWNKPT